MRALEFIVLPYTLSGFGVGFVVGLTGVGGGSLMTPLLVLLFGFHPATAGHSLRRGLTGLQAALHSHREN